MNADGVGARVPEFLPNPAPRVCGWNDQAFLVTKFL
jgi:hypothetical protein